MAYKDKEKQSQYRKAYYLKNRKRELARNHKWDTQNKNRKLKKKRERYYENRDKFLIEVKDYRKNNPHIGRKAINKYNSNPDNKEKLDARTHTRCHEKKTLVCNDCGRGGKTEWHHVSYNPNVVRELCKECHIKREMDIKRNKKELEGDYK